jgi:sugar phosphate permease
LPAIDKQTRIEGLRWWIAGLIFLATLINFLNRLTISVLAPVITEQLHLTNLEFASITNSFLLAYTASQALSCKLYDRVGNRAASASRSLSGRSPACCTPSPPASSA